MASDQPPRFQDAQTSEWELPSYSRNNYAEWDVPPLGTDHIYHLSRKTGGRWLVLTLRSRAESPEDTPVFFQGGTIAGSVKVDFEKEELVDSISVSVTGQVSFFTHNPSGFLTMKRTLWSATEEARRPLTIGSLKHTVRLKGHHEWPFNITLPKGVSIVTHIVNDAVHKKFRLPPSVSDDANGVHVGYELVVRVTRGGFRASNKLIVPFLFVPMLRPSAPPITRQLAYQTNSPLMGVERDLQSWNTLPPVTIRGTVFKSRVVDAICTLSLAKPLCYTRGSPLHLMMTIENDDLQALDLLATPRSIAVCLVKKTSFSPSAVKSRAGYSVSNLVPVNMRTQVLAMAIWWPSTETGSDRYATKRTFCGEIPIPGNLEPRCGILSFALEYAVELRPFVAVAFTAEAAATDPPLLSQAVEIATTYAAGPRPRSFIPPEYVMHDARLPPDAS